MNFIVQASIAIIVEIDTRFTDKLRYLNFISAIDIVDSSLCV
ncbi:12912_t:CDS:2 [Funneliformis mosseae]|uniref:12912_t:CDS:1 n=1 Tax=Funneliformis mosseae TaxID=27381 RepID=A0A9N9BQX2_FUNMO|nr:12912_t:CDS:2 [Funneliformis mosseae]